MEKLNRLVLIGNGFDLAHGLKTTYKDFLDWYMCQCFEEFCTNSSYEDKLIEMKYKFAGIKSDLPKATSLNDVISFMTASDYQNLRYKSEFFERLLGKFNKGSWVNIECEYFRSLKRIFQRHGVSSENKRTAAIQLNSHFDFMISKLSEYFAYINSELSKFKSISIEISRLNIKDAFTYDESSPVTFLNFNYTDTLVSLGYANEQEVLHIHGSVLSMENNPIIFGYGDESDSVYQLIEDSGENVYLDHIKSFGYFKTNNYNKLISMIESGPYVVYIVGHSCGVSDRILLNEIFEHDNCRKIEIFYHRAKDHTDNFKEITQEISRHFKPHNKGLMRKRLGFKTPKNIIPQL